MIRINTLRALPVLAAAALSAAIALPSAADAAGSSGISGGKVSYSDLSVMMSTSDDAGSHHTGSLNFVMGDGSVRFDAYGNFLGGVVVATADSSTVSGRITGVAIDPTDPSADDGCLGCVEVTVKVLN